MFSRNNRKFNNPEAVDPNAKTQEIYRLDPEAETVDLSEHPVHSIENQGKISEIPLLSQYIQEYQQLSTQFYAREFKSGDSEGLKRKYRDLENEYYEFYNLVKKILKKNPLPTFTDLSKEELDFNKIIGNQISDQLGREPSDFILVRLDSFKYMASDIRSLLNEMDRQERKVA